MYTLRDAQRERLQENAKFDAKMEKREFEEALERERQNVINIILKENPQIGVLMRKGKHVYYTYPAGGEYREAKHPSYL
jgi:hypothetical protein